MKRLLGTILALSILGMAAAQSEVNFDVHVDGITAIALGTASTEDVHISYALSGDEFVTMTETSFELRYITNKVAANATIEQDNCEFDATVEGDIRCGEPLKAEMGQFLPAYITIAAGGWDDDDGLYEVAAFKDALTLSVTTSAEKCETSALANNFAAPTLVGLWEGYVIVRGADVIAEYPAVDFEEAAYAFAEASLGESQAVDGLELAFNGVAANLIGDPDTASSLIRGAVCGETAGEGWDVTLTPVRGEDKILPAGTTAVAVQITIHDLDEL